MLKVNSNSLKTLRREEFEELSEFFEQSGAEIYPAVHAARNTARPTRWTYAAIRFLRTAQDRLLFILYHLKGNAIQELIANYFRDDIAATKRIKLLSKLLREGLDRHKGLYQFVKQNN